VMDYFRIAHYASGVVALLIFFYLTCIFTLEKEKKVRPRIFLRYGLFKVAFYILAAGIFVEIIIETLMIGKYGQIVWLRNATDFVHNSAIILFSILMIQIIKPASKAG